MGSTDWDIEHFWILESYDASTDKWTPVSAEWFRLKHAMKEGLHEKRESGRTYRLRHARRPDTIIMVDIL